MHSSLTSAIQLAHPNNYMVGRGGYKVCKITPHHMAGKLTGAQCAALFQNPNRIASANYCIGYDGEIVCNVDEVHRAFTSSNYYNDCQAITIEVSNDQVGGNWHVSDKSWNSLVNLCVDICRRYGFRLSFTGNANGSLTMHKMFAATSCPGPYLESRMAELANTVNSILDGGSAPSGGGGSASSTPDQICSAGSVVVSSRKHSILPGIKHINGDECVQVPDLGGWFPTRLLNEADASDGACDQYLANSNAKVTIVQSTVQAIDARNNLIKIHDIWVDPTWLTEIKDGQ